MKDRFYRPELSSYMRDYVRQCPDCQRIKPSRQRKLGCMSPHDMAANSFLTVSMDILLGLPPRVRGTTTFDACMVIVDQFSKAIILRPMTSSEDARVCGSAFFDALVCRGFLPSKLITDHDPPVHIRVLGGADETVADRLQADQRLSSTS